jgi:glyoxylase-like metal-dependent hydrolase (beta-lactamase superfamily II)
MEQPLKAVIIPVTPFAQNCSVAWCTATGEGAVIDPGGDLARIRAAIETQGIRIVKVLVTHGHVDHAGGVAELAQELSVPIEGPHRDDLFWIDQIPQSGERYGMAGARAFEADRWLADGDTVGVGDVTFHVVHCPGHTPGHVVFVHDVARVAFVGDVLFRGSIGRTDFPRGNHRNLIDSIRYKLWPLGDDITFVPGHGPVSTFGEERRSNPFVSDTALAGM